MDFPKLTADCLLQRLQIPEGRLNLVLDTDTYNEIDDQFALVYALRSPERLKVEAVYAAPFHNQRSTGPGDGMEKSHQEILRVLEFMGFQAPAGFALKGSSRFLANRETPVDSEAARDLIERAMKATQPLYVVAIGAITNVASAILLEPRIIEKIVVVWLGGHALHWHDTKEFNLKGDVAAAQVVLDCGVPLIHLPCLGVVSHLRTTVAELERYLDGKNPIGTYLAQIVRDFVSDGFARSKVVWDISAIACLLNPEWTPANLVHSPIVTDQMTWSFDARRHLIKSVYSVDRDAIFGDLFRKIAAISA